MKFSAAVFFLVAASLVAADVSHLGNDQQAQVPLAQQPLSNEPFPELFSNHPLAQQFPQQPLAQQPFPQQQPFAQQPLAQQPSFPQQQPLAQQPFGQQPFPQKPVAQDTFVQQPFPQKPVAQDTFGQQPFGQPAAQPIGQTLSGTSNPTPVTDICLGCICQASSNCNRTLTCNGEVCGLFRITWAYWSDANKPVQDGDHPENARAFENCVNEPLCAARTVQNYMVKYQQDCNGDNVINCYDHAAIHKLGGYGCNGGLPPAYSNTLQQCLSQAQNFQA